ncbi:GntR family transcriptional regulator [Streptomyces subrutilus]|uniref:GntR family transcriptional regulator n=1 Tax=Streptomyces subrutilus TaxID=36818 RepID=UPI003990DD54
MSGASPRGTYLVISAVLRGRISEGIYGDAMPSEAQIGGEFGVARSTARRAMQALEDAGEITSVPGVGWQVVAADRHAPYREIMADLQRQIREGVLPAGARLPSEAELAETYGVARGTVRRAVRELEAAGYVRAQQGVGRFVSSTS